MPPTVRSPPRKRDSMANSAKLSRNLQANVDKARLLRGTLLPQARASFRCGHGGVRIRPGQLQYPHRGRAADSARAPCLAGRRRRIHIRLAELELLVEPPVKRPIALTLAAVAVGDTVGGLLGG